MRLTPSPSLMKLSRKSIASLHQFHIPHCETRERDRFIAQALPTFASDDMILTR
jgi:hypothetical protein